MPGFQNGISLIFGSLLGDGFFECFKDPLSNQCL